MAHDLVYLPAESRAERWLANVALALVLGNTLVLALDRHPISCDNAVALELANVLFELAFIIEMVV